jgi:Na+/H+ antiporter NhaC
MKPWIIILIAIIGFMLIGPQMFNLLSQFFHFIGTAFGWLYDIFHFMDWITTLTGGN